MLTRKLNLVSIEDVKDFTAAASECKFDVDVKSGKYVIDAKSIMGLFSLNLSEPVTLEVHADESDAREFISKIEKFFVD